VIVGVNKYRLEIEAPIVTREIDNTAVRETQLKRLAEVRARRDTGAVTAALDALTEAARSGHGNLLDLAIKAVRVRATVGEISSALEKVYGRYCARTESVSGVYGAAFENDSAWKELRRDIARFAEEEGRRPRLMVAKLGQDGHDRGAKVIATAFADLGFDVDIGPLFQTPEEVAKDAIDAAVPVIGVSSQAAGHKSLVPVLNAALKKEKADDILVIVGGVIPAQDYPYLEKAGVSAIFGPGTNIPDAARKVLALIRARTKQAA